MTHDHGLPRTVIQVSPLVKKFVVGAFAFVGKSIYEHAFKSATATATDEIAVAIDRHMNGKDIKSLGENDRLVVLTLQKLRDDEQIRLNNELASWPPYKNAESEKAKD